MSEKTIGEKILTWLKNVGQFLVNIKMLLAVLPLVGISVGYFQHDNIKNAVSDQKPEAVKPEIAQPVVENKVIEVIAPAKNYDLVIKELLATNRLQDKKINQLSGKIDKLDKQVETINGRFNALKTWVGWNE